MKLITLVLGLLAFAGIGYLFYKGECEWKKMDRLSRKGRNTP
jgi:hypothetical protein